MKQTNRVMIGVDIKDAKQIAEILDKWGGTWAQTMAFRITQIVKARKDRNVFISKVTGEPEIQTEQEERGTSTKV